jgi:hypothetical protein
VNDWQQHIGVGVDRLSAIIRTPPTRRRVVIADEGPRRGRTAALATDHKSGRQDAEVFPDTSHTKARMPLCRRCRHRACTDPQFLATIRRPDTTAELARWFITQTCVVCGDVCDIDPLNRKDVA